MASDVHLGATHPDQERAFFEWLEHAAETAGWILLNGDLFDFWFEFRWGVPSGHAEALERLRLVVEGGTPVTLMGGNHDWWGGAYLREEIGLEFLQEPIVRSVAGYRTLIAHGDGLGRGDMGYKVTKRILRSSITRGAFGLLPVRLGDRIAAHVSNTEDRWDQWGDGQQDRSDGLEQWARTKLIAEPELDLVLLGHTHLPMVREVAPTRWYVNSGDWVYHRSYVTISEGQEPRLCEWPGGRV